MHPQVNEPGDKQGDKEAPQHSKATSLDSVTVSEALDARRRKAYD